MSMYAAVLDDADEIEAAEFFAPSNNDAIDGLVDRYAKERANIERVAEFMSGDQMQGATRYFFEGNRDRFNRYLPDVKDLFRIEAGVPALDASYWAQALSLTDVMDYMPEKRRAEWNEHITKQTTPPFTEENVRATLGALLGQRANFLAEMVDGIFSGLSSEHVTNRPEGFAKRMIIDYVYGYGGTAYRKAGLVHDLRCVVAKFMGRDTPFQCATRTLLEHVRRNTGTWHLIDGGALRIRVYLKGTAHLEVHPSISYRLNQILAHLHPAAIPAKYRERPRKGLTKAFALIQRPLPFAVLRVLHDARSDGDKLYLPHCWHEADKHVRRQVCEVLEALGGARSDHVYRFDYPVSSVLHDVLATGLIPDHKSHQFYPTPDHLAAAAVAWAEIKPGDACLEPSAGQGALADLMPDPDCVEASALHCAVLEAKGLRVTCGDFLTLAPTLGQFDAVVMNPPFSEGRAMAHVEAAAKLLRPGGRLVAILPASKMGEDVGGLRCEWTGPYENAFPGASVTVAMLRGVR